LIYVVGIAYVVDRFLIKVTAKQARPAYVANASVPAVPSSPVG
jgi:hypothetical protein